MYMVKVQRKSSFNPFRNKDSGYFPEFLFFPVRKVGRQRFISDLGSFQDSAIKHLSQAV